MARGQRNLAQVIPNCMHWRQCW